MGFPGAARRAFPSRPRRLFVVSYRQIYPLRTWLAWQVWVILLLLTRLSIHHQDYLAFGA